MGRNANFFEHSSPVIGDLAESAHAVAKSHAGKRWEAVPVAARDKLRLLRIQCLLEMGKLALRNRTLREVFSFERAGRNALLQADEVIEDEARAQAFAMADELRGLLK